MALLIIIAVIAVLVLWVISVQRKLVSAEELCKNSMGQIGVQQESRWDALKALAELTKSYSEHEYNTLKDIIAQRAKINQNSTAEDVQEQEKAMASAMKQIIAVAERYPELKANDMYNKTMESVNTYENQVRMSRMVYNDSVTRFNRIVRQLPDSLIAGFLGFKEKDYLKEDEAKSEMPSMKI